MLARRSLEESEQEPASALQALGTSLLAFSVVGYVLYGCAALCGVPLEVFLGLAGLLGVLTLVATPGYNPNFSRFVAHGLSPAHIKALALVVYEKRG